jgi:hypothetical protein
MKTLAIALTVCASALFATAASAAPLSIDRSARPDGDIQHVRMVCNDNGRCWRERGERRVIIREPRESYGYDRRRHMERRDYRDDRRGGIGIQVPGVSIGVGR